MKKLIPAFALLLVSAIVLATSSFAWFSMNTQVTASSMTITAKSQKNLLISDTSADTGSWSTSYTWSSDNELTVVPTSTTNAANPTFYKLGTVGSDMAATDSKYGFDSVFVTAEENVDYIKKTLYVKSTGENAGNLIATITPTSGNEKALDASLRVMIVVGGSSTGAAFTYAPNSGASTSTKPIASISDTLTLEACAANTGADADVKAIADTLYYDAADSTTPMATQPKVGEDVTGKYYATSYVGKPTEATTATSFSTSGTQVILGSLTADEAYQIDIYIWFEGQDPACKSTNAVDLDDTVFSFAFSVQS